MVFLTMMKKQLKKSVEDKGGNYVISVGLKNKKYNPIYVGKTKYLETRLLEHLSSNEENECIKDRVGNRILYFHYCYVNNEEDRKNIEYTIYKKFDLECNKIEPEGREILITFP